MEQLPLIITRLDSDEIQWLLWNAGATIYRGSLYLKKLKEELDRATIVEPEEVPPDVVTMNSSVILVDVMTGEELNYTLVYPEDADLQQGKISVLAPIGTAMLGYRVGDTFTWDTPGGIRAVRVEKILYQPETAGNYDL